MQITILGGPELVTGHPGKVLKSFVQDNPTLLTAKVQYPLGYGLVGTVETRRGSTHARLRYGMRERMLPCHVRGITNEERIGVACHDCGGYTNVNGVTLRFRPNDDRLTDRGLVFVRTGSVAQVEFSMRPARVHSAHESAFMLFDEARRAVERQLISLFL